MESYERVLSLGRVVAIGWLFWGVTGALAGVASALGLSMTMETRLDVAMHVAVSVIGGLIVGSCLLLYMFYRSRRTVRLIPSILVTVIVLFIGTIALWWPTEKQLGWVFALLLACFVGAVINWAIIGAKTQPDYHGAIRLLWADSFNLVGTIVAYINFNRMFAVYGHKIVGYPENVGFYRGLGVAVIGGCLAGWLVGNAFERLAPSKEPE